MSKLSITLAPNGGFEVEVPSQKCNGSHRVQIPFTLSGLSILRKLLQERAREAEHTLGMNGSPTQQMVEAWLRRDKELAVVEKKEPTADHLLINLNIEELDL